ncbi:hypothetical protein H4R23_002965 [Coemansia sp. Cherry 401B]|nr:hypothetical protein IWW54_003084 [Coemansia sp. RSA 2705]KAJ2731899.1 hypothetical protein H4R23_002965 [Coemansia sp. Cherry 401B]
MSFALTDKEKLRVALASLLGVHMDPIGASDLAVVVFWSTAHFVQLLAAAYMLAHTRYRPIGSQQPGVMLLVTLASCVWFVGDITANELVHPATPLLRDCVFTAVWLRSALGQTAVLALLSHRALCLFVKYGLRRHVPAAMTLASSALLLATTLTPAVIISVLPRTRTVEYVAGLEICNFDRRFKAAAVGLGWLALAGALAGALLVCVRVRCAHAEGARLLAGALLLGAANAMHTGVFYGRAEYAASRGWRAAVVCVDQAAAVGAWWLLMGRALVGCAWRRQQLLAEWTQESQTHHATKRSVIVTTIQ